MKKYRFRSPEKVLNDLRFDDVPDPALIHEVNDRTLFDHSFKKAGADTLYSCHQYGFRLKIWEKMEKVIGIHTGGDVRFFLTPEAALEDAFNRHLDKVEKELTQNISRFKQSAKGFKA